MVSREQLKKFSKREKNEWKKFRTGRERFRDFFVNTAELLRDFLIPHEGNDHRPHALRRHALTAYVVVAVLIKATVTGLLFFTYPTPGQMAKIVGDRVIELANAAREANGLEKLSVNPVLADTATLKGNDMLSRGYFAHDTPDGKKPWEWINKKNYDYVYAGENLAMGFSNADMIHDAFMKSPGHRQNILNSNYHDIGVAVVSGNLLGQDTDLLVMYFGTTRSDYLVRAAQAKIEAKKPVIDKGTIEVAQASPLKLPEILPVTVSGQVQGDAAGLTLSDGNASAGTPVVVTYSPRAHIISEILYWADIVLVAFIIFLTLAILINVFVHIQIQHTSLIFQSLFALALLSSLFLTRFHFIERLATGLVIS